MEFWLETLQKMIERERGLADSAAEMPKTSQSENGLLGVR
jgi:hypothetical protein